MRLQNHIAKDLRTPKYKQKRVEKKRHDDNEHWSYHDWVNFLENEED